MSNIFYVLRRSDGSYLHGSAEKPVWSKEIDGCTLVRWTHSRDAETWAEFNQKDARVARAEMEAG